MTSLLCVRVCPFRLVEQLTDYYEGLALNVWNWSKILRRAF